MFKKQMWFYVCYQCVVSVVQISIQTIGRIAVHGGEGKILGCTDGGYRWINTSIWGSLFITFHIMVVVMQSVMIEKVFYGVPHHAGYFDDIKKTEDTDKGEVTA